MIKSLLGFRQSLSALVVTLKWVEAMVLMECQLNLTTSILLPEGQPVMST